ncbi:GNAT family N-acetyltransferase [Novosphingobium sp. YJ-S2-02]|uniref:GNAT family N-acetyltransferase n=1 Tax=Novosphingobium aureum TaxID=2792964 RepID=A0A931HD14_9SPHN|nr:GNAT family N-acetyltransferase [Novosphingobium aureum]MBH0113181.1 GNAT family N-acetyltransferase [Novosphingobium aureum]
MSTITATTLPTRSGIEIDVRPATEDDIGLLTAFFDRVSAEDRRFRFLAAAAHVSADQLAPLVKADHFRTESWLGFNKETSELVASGLLACDGPMETGEIAISVSASHRGKGVGWAMLDFLGTQARERGCRKVIAIESRDNHAAIELEREKGFKPEPFEGDPTLVILSKTFP